MLQNFQVNSKKSLKGILVSVSLSIILSTIFLFFLNLHTHKRVVINNIANKNKKLFATEYNREFIGDNERIVIVKNADIINQKIIFDLSDAKIARIKIIPLSNEILKDISIKLYAYNKNKEYVITNNNFVNNILEYKMFETNNERVEVSFKDDPSINSLKAEDIVLIKISYSSAE